MKQINPLVSIVIPVYNGSNYMKEAIDSALAQKYKNIEIIVVNDGSTDNTDEIAKSYGNKIRYFSKENGGVATALNLAIKESKGEYISWLSHDDVYYPNKIQKQIEVLNKLKDKNTILYSNIDIIDSFGNNIGKTDWSKYHKIKNLNYPLYPLMNGIIHGCTLLLPKIIFEKYGYFNINLKCTQDYDYWYKIFPKCKIKFIEEKLIKSRCHDEQDSKKHPDNFKECDELWIKMVSNLTDKQIKKIAKSKFKLYKITFNICKNAKYEGAATYIENKLIEQVYHQRWKYYILYYKYKLLYKIFSGKKRKYYKMKFKIHSKYIKQIKRKIK